MHMRVTAMMARLKRCCCCRWRPCGESDGNGSRESIDCHNYRRASRWRSILAQNTDEFCRCTTIHGLKYVNNRQLRNCERFYFAGAVLLVLLVAAYLILDAFEKWNTTPVIVSIDPEPSYITNEPFPAVTICNMNQALRTQANRFSKESPEYAMLQLLCKRQADPHITNAITNWSRVEEFIFNISQPCAAMVVGCRFGAEDVPCADQFYPIVTDEGLCCVFNMLHPRHMYRKSIPLTLRNVTWLSNDRQPINWYAEQGYPPSQVHVRYYPRAAQGIGESLGLALTLDVAADNYYCSSSNSVGFKIALHSPNESPNVRETGVLLAPGQETKLRIVPSKTVTEQQLRRVHRRYRRCLFHSEGELRYFAHYTQRNCEMECISRMLLAHCGCISFYMPKIRSNASVCSIRKSPCVESVRLQTDAAVESCLDNCLPSCYELTFDVEAFATRIANDGFDIASPPMVANLSRAYVARSIAVVNMYYKDQSFRSYKQTEFIGISDFLSSVGGLMGLFLGFSFLSIAECIFFAFIRPCRNFNDIRQQSQAIRPFTGFKAVPIIKRQRLVNANRLPPPTLHVAGTISLSVCELPRAKTTTHATKMVYTEGSSQYNTFH